MLIIPAVDLYQGKVVRFTRGDPSLSKVYSDDPVKMAKHWENEGAQMLHLVDLSSALNEGDNMTVIREILKEVKVGVEIGGGIREVSKAEKLLSLGAQRIIIGTKVLDEDFLNELIKNLDKEKIAIGVDVIDSCLAVEGWKKRTDFNGLDFITYLQLKGVKWVIYTDISKDGALGGINHKALQDLSLYKDMNIIFSGGVTSIDDLKAIKKKAPFIKGAIIGKALYEGRIDLKNINIDNF